MRRLLADRRGGAAVTTALSIAVLCMVAAATVDLGSLALAGRRLQGAADLSALSGARDQPRAEAAARATAMDNIGADVGVVVVKGLYVADPDVPPDQRFVAGGATTNAVRVTLTEASPLYFGRWLLGRDTLDLTRTGTAAASVKPPRALFSIGSRLARLDGGIANQVLGALTGSTVSLSVMDYEALADAQINLLSFSDALSTDLGLTAGDYDALLDHEVDAGRALRVIERLPGDQADSALSKLAASTTGVNVRLGDLIGVEAGAADGLAGSLDATVSALDLATAMLEIGGGDRQAQLALGARAGLADVTVSLAIGERPNNSPWLTVTDTGSPIIRTAQTRLYVKARTAQKLSGLSQVNLPILIELAASEARLNSIDCTPDRSVELGVRPGLARATIGAIDERHLDDFTRTLTPSRATLLSVLGLVTITAKAEIEAADQTFTATRFSDAQIADQSIRTVQARGLANGLVVSLLQRLDVDIDVIGLGLGLGGLAQALGTLLAPLGPVLDGLINPILDTLGLKFGEADVRIHGVTCPVQGAAAVLVG